MIAKINNNINSLINPNFLKNNPGVKYLRNICKIFLKAKAFPTISYTKKINNNKLMYFFLLQPQILIV